MSEPTYIYQAKDSFRPYSKIFRWEVLTGLCLMNGYRIGAELGVSHGRFTTFLCSHIPDMKMIAVDLWDEQPENVGKPGSEQFLRKDGWYHSEKLENLKKHCARQFPGRVDIRQQHTVEAAKGVKDESLDFVFIDADHTYEGCLADIQAWTPKVRIGGTVAGHDYNDKWPGVIRAVKETGPAMITHDSVWLRVKK